MWLYPVSKRCSEIPDLPGCLRISAQSLAFRLDTNKINHTWCKYSKKQWTLDWRTLEFIKVHSD